MTSTFLRIRTLIVTSVLLVGFMHISACGKEDKGDVWKEEVRLMNGELLILDRENRYGSGADISQSQGPLTWQEMRWTYKGKQYYWGERAVWAKSLQMDSAGRFYIVSTIPYCWAWVERKRPKSDYVVFLFEDEQWKIVPIESVPQDTVFNLAGSSKPPIGERKPYQTEHDWKYKDDIEPYYRKIHSDFPGGAGCKGW